MLEDVGLAGLHLDGAGDVLAKRTYAERIERMRMAVKPGERRPSLALWASPEQGSGTRVLTVAAVASTGVEQARRRPVARYVFYHHRPTPLASPAVGLGSELYVQPFCGL